MSSPASSSKKRSPWLRYAKALVRVAVLVLVVWGVARAILGARDEFAREQFSLGEVDFGLLCLAGVLYLAGTAPAWLFWHRTLEHMQQRPSWLESLRAYYIGHLGKYVPGKALVVVLRTGLVKSARVDAAAAAVSVFIETLTYMAVGAAVAAGLLGLLYREHWQMVLLAVLLMLAAGLPTAPPLFRRLVRMMQVQRVNPEIDQALGGVNGRLMLLGWLGMAAGWLLLGASLWATLASLPQSFLDGRVSLELVPLLTACVALAMVAGFLSLIPGGLGVRELVILTLLAPAVGEAAAVLSAVLLRLVWLLSEAAISIILYFMKGSRDQSDLQSIESASEQVAG